MTYTAEFVSTLTDEELIEACENYEGVYQSCFVLDDPEIYATWFEEAKNLDAEAKERGLGFFFEMFMPEPDWQDIFDEYRDEIIARAEEMREYDEFEEYYGKPAYQCCPEDEELPF